MELFKYNLGPVLIRIAFILEIISVSRAQQGTVSPVFGLASTLQDMINAEVSRQLKATQDIIKRDEFTQLRQEVHELKQNSVQGINQNSVILTFNYGCWLI